jgi:NADH-quinone oxidoreductase subunit G
MARMSATVTVTVDGQRVTVPKGTNVVDAAHQVGIDIPIFCHHPRLVPVGMCRMCLVEVGTPKVNRETGQAELDESGAPVIQFMPKLQTGCTTPASDGMVVRTTTAAVAEARRSVLEFLLTSHPLDCPVCDKGGECPLQNLTMAYGPGQSRFAWGEKFHFPKPVPIGPLMVLDRERCVLCARCIRFQDELADDHVLGFENRGRGMEIVSFSEPPFSTYFSGNTSDVCPVGALTTKDFRFEARAWEVVGQPGVCSHCPVGCNVMHDTRHGRIERVMSRANDPVNGIWLCDKGRFAHHFASSPDRLTTPLVRVDGQLVPATWDEALARVADGLRAVLADHGPAAVGGIAGAGLPNEDLYLFGRFLRAVVGTHNVDHRPAIVRDDVLLAAGAGAATDLAGLGRGSAVLVVGLDVEEEAPVLFLHLHQAVRKGARVVPLGGRPQKLDRHAAVLRWRYGAEDAVLAALARAVLVCRGGEAGPGAADLAESVAAYTEESLVGVAPVGDEQLAAAATALAEAENLVILYGREAQSVGLVPGLAALAVATGHAGRADNGLMAVGRHANAQGAADMGLLPDWLPGYRPVGDDVAHAALAEHWPQVPAGPPGLDAGAMLSGAVRALFLAGTDPAADDSDHQAALAGLDLLVVQELFLTRTAELAHVVLPAQSAPERAGTFTNFARRVQRFYAAVDPVGQSRPGWVILRDLGLRLGRAEAYDSAADVFAEIARVVPQYAGLSVDTLGAPAPPDPGTVLLPFAPITAARRVSYQGTAYENGHGTGAVWPVPAAPERAPTWRPRPAQVPEGLTLVPVARLYDFGTLVAASPILHPLIAPPHVLMSPFDAAPRGLADGGQVRVAGGRGAVTAELRVQEGLTPGVLLLPESLAWDTPPRVLLDGHPYGPVTVEPA